MKEHLKRQSFRDCLCQKPHFSKDGIKSNHGDSWWTPRLPGSASHPHSYTQSNGQGWAFTQTPSEKGSHMVKSWEDEKHRLEPLCFWEWEREEIYLNAGRLPSMGHHGGFQHLQLPTGAISLILSYHGLCIWLWNLNLLFRWFPVPLGMLQNVC